MKLRLLTGLILILGILAACSNEDKTNVKPELTAGDIAQDFVLESSNLADARAEVPNLSGARGSNAEYSIDIPAGATNLVVTLSGGSGDPDLYVRFGSKPTINTYDCRSFDSGTTERCAFAAPRTGKYYILVRGYTSYSGVTLAVTYDEATPPTGGGNTLSNGVPVNNISATQDNTRSFTLNVPAGARNLRFVMSGGTGDADLYVRFGSAPTTNSYDCRPYKGGNNETCTFDSPSVGTYYVNIRAYSSFSGVSLVASYETGSTGGGSGNYNIQFVFGNTVSAAQRDLFNRAGRRWEEVIRGDIPNVPVNKAANACGQNEPAYNGTVDDIIIYANVGPRDGQGGVLASAGPCLLRSGANGLTSYGIMNFDSADSNGPELYETILHEMGHVLGIGTLWSRQSLVNYTGRNCPSVPRYSGTNARREWQALGGSGNVPVEESGGGGTACGHWDEATFNTELMTGYSEGAASEPLSRMTIGTLQDMGYTVDYSVADSYSVPSCSPNCSNSISTQSLNIARGEELLMPIGTTDAEGNIEAIGTIN